MDSLRPSDLAVIAAGPLALPAALIKIEYEEGCDQPEGIDQPEGMGISTASHHASLHKTPSPPRSEASDTTENSNNSLPLAVLRSTNNASDRFPEDLLRSFQDASVPSPSTPDTVKPRAEEPVAKSDSARLINHQALITSINSEFPLDILAPPSCRAPTVSTISDILTSPSADDSSKPRDHRMATTPSLSQQSVANSKSPSPSSEELQVRLLQGRVEEAVTAQETLQQKAGMVWCEKQEYDNASAGLKRDLEAIKNDIKGLHAEKRQTEAAVRRKKDRQNEITYEKQLIEGKSRAKWEEGKAVKRDIDEAARSRRILEKQLKEAKVQEELFNLYPDAGLRKFAEHALKNEEHSRLFNAFVQGQARDDDLDAIENLLEEAEDGTKNDIKVEFQPLQSGRGETGAISDTDASGPGILTRLLARAESLVKSESVRIKTEYSTPTPSPPRGNSSSPTAQGLLDAVRQMKACRNNLQAQLCKINSLKRKHQQDDDDNDVSAAPTRRFKSVKRQLDIDTNTKNSSDSDE